MATVSLTPPSLIPPPLSGFSLFTRPWEQPFWLLRRRSHHSSVGRVLPPAAAACWSFHRQFGSASSGGGGAAVVSEEKLQTPCSIDRLHQQTTLTVREKQDFNQKLVCDKQ